MINISLDKSRNVRIFARVGETSVPRPLVFYQEDGETPYNISALDFKLFVFKRQNTTQKLFTLSIGSGLTVGGSNNELLIEITAAQADQIPGTYFYRLHSTTEDHTWLNGPFTFHMGEFDNIEEEETVNIYQND